MALNSDVTVKLEGGQSAGLLADCVPLFVVPNAVSSKEALSKIPYTECSTLDDVVSAGFSKDSKLYKAVQLFRSQPDKPKTFAVYGGTGTTVKEDMSEWSGENWRQLITVSLGTGETIKDIAAEVEALDDKMYFVSIAVDGADTMTDSAFETAWKNAVTGLEGYDRTVIMYYDNSVETPEAALVGATAALSAGSFTYKNIILKGLSPLRLSESRVKTISGLKGTACGLSVVRKAGDIVTTDGKTAAGEWIDVVDSRDKIVKNITYDTQRVFNVNKKVPFTNAGIAQLENATLSVLKDAFNSGMIAPQDDNENIGNYSTDFTPASDLTPEQRANRHYDGGHFSFRLAGAVHTAEINGTVST